jgi:hypothetical protein
VDWLAHTTILVLKYTLPFLWKKVTEEQRTIARAILATLKDDESLVQAIIKATNPMYANEGFRHLLAQDPDIAKMLANCHTLAEMRYKLTELIRTRRM